MILSPQMLRMTGQRDRRQERLATSTEMERSRVLVSFGGRKRLISSTRSSKSASLAQGYTGHGRYAITASKVLMPSISFNRWTALPFVY